MKIDYERKLVSMSWFDFGRLSESAQQELIGQDIAPQTILANVKKGMSGSVNYRADKTLTYSGAGLLIHYVGHKKASVEDFYKMIPDEVKAIQIDQDLLSAMGIVEDDDMENE